jgi:uncharacterized membrane protein YfcA
MNSQNTLEILIYIILFTGGVLGGLYGSNVGGGALFTFPLLILIGLPTSVAIGTQRLGATILEFCSACKFYKEKKLNLKQSLPLALTASIGALIGSQFILLVSERILNVVVGIAFLIISLLLFFKDKLKIKKSKTTKKNILLLYLVALLLGIYGGFFGAGFGTLIVFLLVFMGFTFIESAAMGRVIGFLMSLTTTIIFSQGGIIHYSYGLTLGFGFAIGAWLGIDIALKKGENYVKSLLFIVAIFSVLKLLGAFLDIHLF